MKTNLKTPILSAIAFFCTLGILSVGYSAYVSSYPATATAGVTSLSAGEWNKMVSALQALDGKLSTFALSGSNVWIGIAAPAYQLHLKGIYPYLAMQDSEDPNGSVGTITSHQDWRMYYDANNNNSSTPGSHHFRADGALKHLMVLQNNGRVWIGTTNPTWHLEVSGNVANGYVWITNENTAAGWLRWTWLNGSTGSPLGAGKMCFETGGVCRFNLDNSGNATAATFNGVSDSRLKTNVESVSGLDAVERLRWVEFEWKNGTGKSSGVIAQELETVLPHLVAVDSSPEKMRSVNYAGLSAYFIEAIKELKKSGETKQGEIDALRKDNDALRDELSKMDARISELEKR